jgi:MFS family permease
MSRDDVSDGEAASPVTRARALFLVLLWVNALPVIASTSTAPTLPILARVFSDQAGVDRLIPLVITLGPLAVALSGPLVGFFLDRFGRRVVLVFGAVLFSFGGAAPVVLNDLRAVVGSRIFVGIAVSCLMTGAATVISDQYSGSARGRVLAYQAAIVGTVATLFILLSGFLAQIGWRAPFFVFLIALPLIPVLLAIVPESKPDGPGSSQPSDDPELMDTSMPASEPRDLRQPRLRLGLLVPALYFGMLGLQAANFLAIVQLPFLLEQRFAAGPALVGSVIALATLAYATGALLSVGLAVRLEPRLALAVALVAIGVGYLGMASGGLAVLMVSNALSGIGFGLIVPNFIAWLAAVAPVLVRGRLLGGLVASLFLGQFISSALWAPVVAAVGSGGALALAGAIAIGIALVLILWTASRCGAERGQVHSAPNGKSGLARLPRPTSDVRTSFALSANLARALRSGADRGPRRSWDVQHPMSSGTT